MSQRTFEQSSVSASSPVAPVTTQPVTRWASIAVCGSPVRIEDPEWCTGCDGDAVIVLEDVQHQGAEVALTLPGLNGAEAAVTVQLTSWPFSEKPAERAPYLSLVSSNGDCMPLDAALAESVAVGLEAHAQRVRALTGLLAEA
jgi:hypothetical protein